ncbi:MAG: hypothetical protein IPK79_01545 [Vampirovibrionales bacterium]|nr:hypothetical protein [Vampirovibrionales bacterium]
MAYIPRTSIENDPNVAELRALMQEATRIADDLSARFQYHVQRQPAMAWLMADASRN